MSWCNYFNNCFRLRSDKSTQCSNLSTLNKKKSHSDSSSICLEQPGTDSYLLTLKNKRLVTKDDIYRFKHENNQIIEQASKPKKNGLSIILPDTVETIEEHAFDKCLWIKSIRAKHLKEIGEYAFCQCTKLETIYTAMLEKIHPGAFNYCEKLRWVYFPKLTTLENDVFNECWSLKSVTLPNVAIVNERTFRNCIRLTNVKLSKSQIVKNYAFSGCRSLTMFDLSNVTKIGPFFLFSDQIGTHTGNLSKIKRVVISTHCHDQFQSLLKEADELNKIQITKTKNSRSDPKYRLITPDLPINISFHNFTWITEIQRGFLTRDFAMLFFLCLLKNKKLPELPFELQLSILGLILFVITICPWMDYYQLLQIKSPY